MAGIVGTFDSSFGSCLDHRIFLSNLQTRTSRLTTAQSLAIVAFCFSIPSVVLAFLLGGFGLYSFVASYVVLAILLAGNIVGLVLFQIPWCSQKGPGFLYTAGGFAILLTAAMLYVGISEGLYLQYSFLTIISCVFGVVGAIGWVVAAVLTFLHVRSVKQAESEQEPSKPQADPDVEAQQAVEDASGEAAAAEAE